MVEGEVERFAEQLFELIVDLIQVGPEVSSLQAFCIVDDFDETRMVVCCSVDDFKVLPDLLHSLCGRLAPCVEWTFEFQAFAVLFDIWLNVALEIGKLLFFIQITELIQNLLKLLTCRLLLLCQPDEQLLRFFVNFLESGFLCLFTSDGGFRR